jgi:hypothetical protein
VRMHVGGDGSGSSSAMLSDNAVYYRGTSALAPMEDEGDEGSCYKGTSMGLLSGVGSSAGASSGPGRGGGQLASGYGSPSHFRHSAATSVAITRSADARRPPPRESGMRVGSGANPEESHGMLRHKGESVAAAEGMGGSGKCKEEAESVRQLRDQVRPGCDCAAWLLETSGICEAQLPAGLQAHHAK